MICIGEGVNRHQATMDEGIDGALLVAAEVTLHRHRETLSPNPLHVFAPVAGGRCLPTLATNRAQMLDAVLDPHGLPARLSACRLLLCWLIHRCSSYR